MYQSVLSRFRALFGFKPVDDDFNVLRPIQLGYQQCISGIDDGKVLDTKGGDQSLVRVDIAV